LSHHLHKQTKRFLADKSKNDFSDPKNIKISSIFDWYKGDFEKKEGSVVAFINKYRTENGEISSKLHDGTIKHFLCNAHGEVEDGKLLRVWGIDRDITERKKAEEIQKVLYNISNAVIATENLEELIGRVQIELGKIIDATNFHIALYDEKSDSISVPFFLNKEVDISEVVKGKTLTRYLIKQKRSLLINKEKLIELRKSNEIGGFEVDPEIWIGVPLKNEGMLTGVLAVQSYTDKNAYNESDLRMLEFVSDQVSTSILRKKAELDLVEALDKATESDRLKSAFLATMSHELRTPLNAIIGFSDFLNKDLPVDDVVNFGKIINSSGQHLLSIVNDLFDITLIEAGEIKVKNKETSLKDILYGVHSVIEAKKQRDNKEAVELKLNFSAEEEDFSFNTDANKIKQILINLLKNAIKFTHDGHIHYGCELLKEKNNAFLKFYVKDTGIGISKDKQNLIFDIFRQADDTHTRKYGGTGIGLSVAKRLVEILGGKIWLESEVGVGSTFYFTIPVEKPESVSLPSLEGEEAETIADSKTIIILIVEDDLMSFKFIEVVLNKLEIKFIWAQNGEEAIRMCKENKDIDLVLMDINMPLLNGYAATKEIKQMRPGLPIIAQTAVAIAGDREKSIEAGCDDYITKPIKKDELIAMIKKYLNR
ncbi:MAG: ATP-binding protein, partial [Draconibacterium sp.]|nr:ATP-binding protein [Draconibacterium sp.]